MQLVADAACWCVCCLANILCLFLPAALPVWLAGRRDVREHCEHVVPGSARVIQCLEENRSKLSRACSASLFDHEVKMAGG